MLTRCSSAYADILSLDAASTKVNLSREESPDSLISENESEEE